MKKIPLCILCLKKGNKEHICPVGKCAKCGGHHNISLCPKAEEECAMRIEENDGNSTDSEDDEIQDYTSNRENINILTRRRETSNAKDKEN